MHQPRLSLGNRTCARQAGFTLPEMMISVLLMVLLIGLGTQLFIMQSSAMTQHAGRHDAQRNAQYAAGMIERELRIAGIGVVDKQPVLVQADSRAITFNVDLVARDTGDYEAVYVNPDADPATTDGLIPPERITLPLSAVGYPDSAYRQIGGVPTTAETISFWVAPDSTNPKAGEFTLFRRTNLASPQVVAKGLRVPAGSAVFTYFYSPTDSIAPVKLPLVHTIPIHGSAGDTGIVASRLVDSVRFVRVHFEGEFYDPKTQTSVIRKIESFIHISNAGLKNHKMCGDPPVAPAAVTAVATNIPIPQVTITWARNTDELGGEKDVERYALFKRADTTAAFSEPFRSVVAGGSATYTFVDYDVKSGDRLIYGLAAEDCTPAMSSVVTSLTAIVP